MAVYCVLTRTDTDWGEPSDRFNTRAGADERLKELIAAGQKPRLVRWKHNEPKELDPVPRDEAMSESSSTSDADERELAAKRNASLVGFIQDQFRRIDCWCWDTVIEEVALVHEIPLNADLLTYAGGAMRTGPYRFRTNDAKWRARCEAVQADNDEALRIVTQVEAALRSPNASGVAQSWRRMIDSRIAADESGYVEFARHHLNSSEMYIFDVGVRQVSPTIDGEKSVVYALWRLGAKQEPIQPFPLYVGEGSGTARARLEGSHRNWWGDQKPIGVTVCTVNPDERLAIEKAVIRMLVPFCNVKGREFDLLWDYPRP